MKKAMLFFVALLFTAGVNAASITISDVSGSNSTFIGAFPNGGDNATAALGTEGTKFEHSVNVNVDTDAFYRVEWGFNPAIQLITADLSGAVAAIGISDNFITSVFLAAGDHVFSIAGLTQAGGMTYNLSVAAVPVPAAAFLFAPALLGFLGLRRKSTLAA
jgi:hypothetical protein